MKEIIIDNDLNIRVFINGKPDIKLIPQDIAKRLITVLEKQISNYEDKE